MTDKTDEVRKKGDQAFWRRYFSVYDTLNEAIPYRRLIERLVQVIAPRSGETILDAGTGTGNLAVGLLKSGASVTGIDFCEPAIERCLQKAPEGKFLFGDLTEQLKFESNHFDKITCCNVLHLLDDSSREFALREFYRILKPGGLLAINVIGTGFSASKIYLETLREEKKRNKTLRAIGFGLRYSIATIRIIYYVTRIKKREKQGDYHFFGREELVKLLELSGFQIEVTEPSFASQCILALARKPRLDPTTV